LPREINPGRPRREVQTRSEKGKKSTQGGARSLRETFLHRGREDQQERVDGSSKDEGEIPEK